MSLNEFEVPESRQCHGKVNYLSIGSSFIENTTFCLSGWILKLLACFLNSEGFTNSYSDGIFNCAVISLFFSEILMI